MSKPEPELYITEWGAKVRCTAGVEIAKICTPMRARNDCADCKHCGILDEPDKDEKECSDWTPKADLTVKLEEAKELGEKLMAARTLELRFPGLFDKGPVTMKLYSDGVEGPPMVKLMLVDGTEHLVKLVELPVKLLKGFEETASVMATQSKAHNDWRTVVRLIKESK